MWIMCWVVTYCCTCVLSFGFSARRKAMKVMVCIHVILTARSSTHLTDNLQDNPVKPVAEWFCYWIMLELKMMEVVVTTGAVRFAMLQVSRHPTSKHPACYRLYALLVTHLPFLLLNQPCYHIPRICSRQAHLGSSKFQPCLWPQMGRVVRPLISHLMQILHIIKMKVTRNSVL